LQTVEEIWKREERGALIHGTEATQRSTTATAAETGRACDVSQPIFISPTESRKPTTTKTNHTTLVPRVVGSPSFVGTV